MCVAVVPRTVPRTQKAKDMAAAATARQAATDAHRGRSLLLDLLVKVGDAAACGSVRLLREELAAAPQAGPQRQGQQGAAAGQATQSRTRRRREQQRGGARAASLEQRGGGRRPRRVQRADQAGEEWKCRAKTESSSGAGGRRAARGGRRGFRREGFSGGSRRGRARGSLAGVSLSAADSAGTPLRCQQLLL